MPLSPALTSITTCTLLFCPKAHAPASLLALWSRFMRRLRKQTLAALQVAMRPGVAIPNSFHDENDAIEDGTNQQSRIETCRQAPYNVRAEDRAAAGAIVYHRMSRLKIKRQRLKPPRVHLHTPHATLPAEERESLDSLLVKKRPPRRPRRLQPLTFEPRLLSLAQKQAGQNVKAKKRSYIGYTTCQTVC